MAGQDGITGLRVILTVDEQSQAGVHIPLVGNPLPEEMGRYQMGWAVQDPQANLSMFLHGALRQGTVLTRFRLFGLHSGQVIISLGQPTGFSEDSITLTAQSASSARLDRKRGFYSNQKTVAYTFQVGVG